VNRRILCAVLAAGAVCGLILLAGPGAPCAQAADEGFVKLYNGKDLTGWHAKDGKIEGWKANGEMISCVGSGGWLTTDREYGDFELRLEYRIPAGGNSGVGIRYPAAGDPAHVGMEIQILDDNAPQYKDLKPAQHNGGIYYQSPPKAKASKPPGEWNRYVIRCQGPKVVVHLNGVEIQNINVEEFTRGEGGYKPLAERPRKGFIGLQSHGAQVDFRNIEIKEL
jgi:3-keto-disaccharide hydrolase